VDWPPFIKFVVLTLGSTALLLLSYEFCVRRTWLGAMLNGRRHPRIEARGVSNKT
jgi:hypothetical protein